MHNTPGSQRTMQKAKVCNRPQGGFGVWTCLLTHVFWSFLSFKGGSLEAVWRIQI